MMFSPAKQGPGCGRYEVHQYARRYAQNPQCAGCGWARRCAREGLRKSCAMRSSCVAGLKACPWRAREGGPVLPVHRTQPDAALVAAWVRAVRRLHQRRACAGLVMVQGLTPSRLSREPDRKKALTPKARCPAPRCRPRHRCVPAGKNACAAPSSRRRRPRAARWRSPQSSSRPRWPASAVAGWC